MRVSKKVTNLLDVCLVYNVHFLCALKCTHLSLALRFTTSKYFARTLSITLMSRMITILDINSLVDIQPNKTI